MNTDPDLKCLCVAPDNKCLAKGLIDLFPCLGAPMVASLPHFYLVDEVYLTQVDGLHPNKVNINTTIYYNDYKIINP